MRFNVVVAHYRKHCDANSVIPQKKSEKVFFRISVVCKIFKNWHSVPSYENCSLATDINL